MQKDIKIEKVAEFPAFEVQRYYIDLTTSLGNKFRCRVLEGMLSSGRLDPIVELDDLTSEKEWEVAERYAEEVFSKAGLLKEKTWD